MDDDVACPYDDVTHPYTEVADSDMASFGLIDMGE
jgi:hypothetical protein